jgi:hypothetical protein
VDNILAIIARDGAEALALVNDGNPLPDFIDRQKSRRWDMQFPFVAVFGSRTVFQTGPEGLIGQAHTVLVEVVLLGSVAVELTTQLQQYVQAVDWIIRSASEADMAEGMSPDGFAILMWDVTAHTYDVVRAAKNKNQQYVQAATLTVELTTAEE